MRPISEINLRREETKAFISARKVLSTSLKSIATIACYLKTIHESCSVAMILYNKDKPNRIPYGEGRLYDRFDKEYSFLSGEIINFLIGKGNFEAGFIHMIIDCIIQEEIELMNLLIERDVIDEIEEMNSFFKRGHNYFLLDKNDFICNGQQLIDDFEPESDSFEFYLLDSCTIKYNQIVPTALYFVKLPRERNAPFVSTMAEKIEYISRNELVQKIRKIILNDWLEEFDISK